MDDDSIRWDQLGLVPHIAHSEAWRREDVSSGPFRAAARWSDQNAADIDGARVVWARDAGAAENEKLRQYYPGRRVWLLEPDARPPKLSPFERPLESGASP